ncbi:hypothetical protein DPMN_136452 [Dreissena polymorpha]|uniref:Uncharacterized protein n=1 Tax=Dreissena polymorpha TaxID=45954 RepID=A0A9D4JHU5_DREPO|nr:hypothetical protein DPMN_136452 [Dreissena polymorpha]
MAEYTISDQYAPIRGATAVNRPHIISDTLYKSRRFTDFRSEMCPKTTRPTVFVIPTADRSQEDRNSLIPEISGCFDPVKCTVYRSKVIG